MQKFPWQMLSPTPTLLNKNYAIALIILLLSEPISPAMAELDQTLFLKPEEGGARRWEVASDNGLDLYAKPSSDAASIATLADRSILSSFGCEDVEGQVWCQVKSIEGGRRGFVPAQNLLPARGEDGQVILGQNTSSKRARKQDFDAKGDVLCAQERGQVLGDCVAHVARDKGRDATIVVTFSNGFSRRLMFLHGQFVSANSTMSGVGNDIDWHFEQGVHAIRVDDQRYELSDKFVFGE